jgi:hypothetical protein
MAFEITANEPAQNPPVTVTFSGLMVLKPGPNNTCDVGVHRFDREHLFQVILIESKPNRPPALTPLFLGPLMAPFSVGLSSEPEVGDFMAFAPTPDPFVRSAESHEKDFRWAINFREHHQDAQINGGAEPGISLKTGVLYTPNLTRPGLAPRLTRQGGDIQLHQIAEDLAVSIVPPVDTNVVLQWEDLGVKKIVTLPLDGDPNTTYTVAFSNNPPNLTVTPNEHDELALYYRILKDGNSNPIDDALQFRLAIAANARSDEVPCMSTTLNP